MGLMLFALTLCHACLATTQAPTLSPTFSPTLTPTLNSTDSPTTSLSPSSTSSAPTSLTPSTSPTTSTPSSAPTTPTPAPTDTPTASPTHRQCVSRLGLPLPDSICDDPFVVREAECFQECCDDGSMWNFSVPLDLCPPPPPTTAPTTLSPTHAPPPSPGNCRAAFRANATLLGTEWDISCDLPFTCSGLPYWFSVHLHSLPFGAGPGPILLSSTFLAANTTSYNATITIPYPTTSSSPLSSHISVSARPDSRAPVHPDLCPATLPTDPGFEAQDITLTYPPEAFAPSSDLSLAELLDLVPRLPDQAEATEWFPLLLAIATTTNRQMFSNVGNVSYAAHGARKRLWSLLEHGALFGAASIGTRTREQARVHGSLGLALLAHTLGGAGLDGEASSVTTELDGTETLTFRELRSWNGTWTEVWRAHALAQNLLDVFILPSNPSTTSRRLMALPVSHVSHVAPDVWPTVAAIYEVAGEHATHLLPLFAENTEEYPGGATAETDRLMGALDAFISTWTSHLLATLPLGGSSEAEVLTGPRHVLRASVLRAGQQDIPLGGTAARVPLAGAGEQDAPAFPSVVLSLVNGTVEVLGVEFVSFARASVLDALVYRKSLGSVLATVPTPPSNTSEVATGNMTEDAATAAAAASFDGVEALACTRTPSSMRFFKRNFTDWVGMSVEHTGVFTDTREEAVELRAKQRVADGQIWRVALRTRWLQEREEAVCTWWDPVLNITSEWKDCVSVRLSELSTRCDCVSLPPNAAPLFLTIQTKTATSDLDRLSPVNMLKYPTPTYALAGVLVLALLLYPFARARDRRNQIVVVSDSTGPSVKVDADGKPLVVPSAGGCLLLANVFRNNHIWLKPFWSKTRDITSTEALGMLVDNLYLSLACVAFYFVIFDTTNSTFFMGRVLPGLVGAGGTVVLIMPLRWMLTHFPATMAAAGKVGDRFLSLTQRGAVGVSPEEKLHGYGVQLAYLVCFGAALACAFFTVVLGLRLDFSQADCVAPPPGECFCVLEVSEGSGSAAWLVACLIAIGADLLVCQTLRCLLLYGCRSCVEARKRRKLAKQIAKMGARKSRLFSVRRSTIMHFEPPEEDLKDSPCWGKFKRGLAQARHIVMNDFVLVPAFNMLIVGCIVLTAILLLLDDPSQRHTEMGQFLDKLETWMLGVFTFEAVLKLFGLGHLYFTGWNILDLILVVTGYLSFVPGVDLGALRIARILRVLRVAYVIPMLEVLVRTLLRSMSGIMEVGLIVLFIYVVWAIIGLRLFSGRLQQRCFHVQDTDFRFPQNYCTMASNPGFFDGLGRCAVDFACSPNAPNPAYGAFNFDNAGYSFLTLFTSMTLDGWDDRMYAYQDTITPLSWIFFVSWVFVSCWLVMNLVLAVISDNYNFSTDEMASEEEQLAGEQAQETEERRKAREEEEREADIQMLKAQQKAQRTAQLAVYNAANKAENEQLEEKVRATNQKEPSVVKLAPADIEHQNRNEEGHGDNVEAGDRSQQTHTNQNDEDNAGDAGDDCEDGDVGDDGAAGVEVHKKHIPGLLETSEAASLQREQVKTQMVDALLQVKNGWDLLEEEEAERQQAIIKERAALVEARASSEWKSKHMWFKSNPPFMLHLDTIVSSNEWYWTWLSIIVFNMVCIFFERGPAAPDWLFWANVAFCCVYCLEMGAKLFARGPTVYVLNPYTLFEGILVIFALLEYAFYLSDIVSLSTTFHALLSLRVFRFLFSFAVLRQLFNRSAETIPSVAAMLVLMILFVFVAGVLGKHMFGTVFQTHRWHFKSNTMAMVTVFQILTGDNWTTVMYDSIGETGGLMQITYFIVVIIFGNYLIVNMFIAIMLARFSNTTGEIVENENLVREAVRKRCLMYVTENDLKKGDLKRLAAAADKEKTADNGNSEDSPAGMEMVPMAEEDVQVKQQKEEQADGDRDASDGAQENEKPEEADKEAAGQIEDPPASPPPPPPAPGPGSDPEAADEDEDRASGQEDDASNPNAQHKDTEGTEQEQEATPAEEPEHTLHGDNATLKSAANKHKSTPQPRDSNATPQDNKPNTGATAKQHAEDHGSKDEEDERAVMFAADTKPDAAASGAAGASNAPVLSAAATAAREAAIARYVVRRLKEKKRVEAAKEDERRAECRDHIESLLQKNLSRKLKDKAAQKLQQVLAGDDAIPIKGTSCACLKPDSRVRIWMTQIASHKWFDRIVVLAIVLNCLLLAMDKPAAEEDNVLAMIVYGSDFAFAIIFTLEIVIKMAAQGIIRDSTAFLRNSWNIMDAIVVLSLLLAFVPALSFLKSLRATRPLRFIVRNENMRVVLVAIFRALPTLSLVVLYMAVFWFVFGLVGVQLFAGQFWRCNDDSVTTQAQCIGTFEVVEEVTPFVNVLTGELENLALNVYDRVWANRFYHYDDPYNAFLALFQAASGNAWSDQMYDGMDVAGVGMQPVQENNPQNALFFIAFFIICAYFTLNLFIGAVVDNYFGQKAQADGSALLTSKQKNWVLIQQLVRKTRLGVVPPLPFSGYRRWAAYLVLYPKTKLMHDPQHADRAIDIDVSTLREELNKPSYFDKFILSIITLNAVMMLTQGADASPELDAFTFYTSWTFSVIFAVEVLVRVAGTGWWLYQRDPWNRFDFLVVAGNTIGSLIVPRTAGGIAALRVARLVRLFRLFRRLKTLATLTETLYVSLPKFGNLFALLFAIFYMYAVLGVQLFGLTPLVGDQGGFGFDSHANFRTFPNALLTLFRLSTADAWGPIHAGGADCRTYTEGCWGPFGSLYFVSFVIFVSYIMLNLFIAVILESFGQTGEPGVEEKILESFKDLSETWNFYDPLAMEYLDGSDFVRVLKKCALGFGGHKVSDLTVLRFLQKIEVPMMVKKRILLPSGVYLYQPMGVVVFKPTLRALVGAIFGRDLTTDWHTEQDKQKRTNEKEMARGVGFWRYWCRCCFKAQSEAQQLEHLKFRAMGRDRRTFHVHEWFAANLIGAWWRRVRSNAWVAGNHTATHIPMDIVDDERGVVLLHKSRVRGDVLNRAVARENLARAVLKERARLRRAQGMDMPVDEAERNQAELEAFIKKCLRRERTVLKRIATQPSAGRLSVPKSQGGARIVPSAEDAEMQGLRYVVHADRAEMLGRLLRFMRADEDARQLDEEEEAEDEGVEEEGARGVGIVRGDYEALLTALRALAKSERRKMEARRHDPAFLLSYATYAENLTLLDDASKYLLHQLAIHDKESPQ